MSTEENVPLSSDEENSSNNVTLERVIEECGSFGRYQYMHFFFLILFPVATGVYNFYYVFASAETSYQCITPYNISQGFSLEISPSQCSYEIKNVQNQTMGIFPCTNWIYNPTIYGRTFTEEANFICQHSFYHSLLATTLQIGAMFTFFTGRLTDWIGRRCSLRLLVGQLLVTSLITQGLLQFVPMSTNHKFILVLISQFSAGIDTYIASFILILELTTSSHAAFTGNLALVAYSVGEVIVTGMAYICQHWLLLKWAMTLYMLALVPYLIFVPESPHWLLTKHRYAELKQVLHQMAQTNRRSDSRWLIYYQYLIDNHRKQKYLNQKNKVKLSFLSKSRRFLTHVPTMSKLFISGFLGFVTLLLYFKVSFGLGTMKEINLYLNMIIGAIVEAIGYIASSLLMIRYGRKPIFIVFLILTIIYLLLTPLASHLNHTIIIIVAQLGKFAISGAVGVTYIFVPELFPTTIRATGMGFFALLSRFGSSVAPIIDTSISRNTSFVTYINYIYALLTIICVLLTLLLPETRNIPLTDKINYNSNRNEKAPSKTQSITRT
ncbi:unnamed protein product [Rotaria socialis]|uniref:Major facilitator superfamily (MFS) profile domain-containing protein n=1 Tax=Rotaria socialis TaxID=392032 RepID=A0A818CJD4_9BILA|nr:unnamed protein product [Rotaria socialis]CAF4589405.1 unnamed protein product [Rotaria socialis]